MLKSSTIIKILLILTFISLGYFKAVWDKLLKKEKQEIFL